MTVFLLVRIGDFYCYFAALFCFFESLTLAANSLIELDSSFYSSSWVENFRLDSDGETISLFLAKVGDGMRMVRLFARLWALRFNCNFLFAGI